MESQRFLPACITCNHPEYLSFGFTAVIGEGEGAVKLVNEIGMGDVVEDGHITFISSIQERI
jgi:hypothetical protein